MGVWLRKKQNKDGTTSQYLDIYHGGKRYYEFLNELKLIKPQNPIDRVQNKERQAMALQIKNKRAIELQGQDHDVVPAFKAKIDFVAYFQAFIDKYPNKDKRVVVSALFRFKEFLKESGIKDLQTNLVNESLIEEFKNHLEKNLNGESPSNYFKKFKKVIKQATRDKIFLNNPSADVRIKRKEAIQKDTLSIQEIQKLAKTPITNLELGRAFIFCCYTGIRWCDLKILKWNNIDLEKRKLSIKQLKTGVKVDLNLHEAAVEMIQAQDAQNEQVFKLPSHPAALKSLKYWIKKAGIQKHITWHCARHSFATNVLFYGAGALEVSKLLGHTNLAYTQKYTRIVDSMKQKAVDNLPGLS